MHNVAKVMAVPAGISCAPLIMGGYDCDFVEPPPDSLQCPVCLLPFREPVLLSCCGHKGCASCIGRIKAAGHPCPLCQQPFETMLDKHFRRKVLDLRAFCSKKGEGCPWVGELRDLETHLGRDCDHVEEECRYGCCGRYQRRLLRDHEMDECPQRPPEVITQSMIRKMAERMDKIEAVHQAQLAAHREDQAKLNQQIQQLQLENATLQDESRKVTKKMEDVDGQLQQAFQAQLAAVENAHNDDQAKLKEQIQQLQKENATLLDESRKVTKKIEDLEGQLQQAFEAKLAAVENAHHEDQAKLNQQIQQLQKENALMQDEKGKLTRKTEDLEGQLHQVKAKLADAEHVHHQDQAKLDQQIQHLKENASTQDEKAKLTSKMEQLESLSRQETVKSNKDKALLQARVASLEKAYLEDHQTIQGHNTHLRSLLPTHGPVWLVDAKGTVSSPWAPTYILMPQFSKHKRDDDAWYSQPFYSGPGGYKLCLSVYANGNGSGKGTHVSVFIHLMKGENDDQLQWPFEHAVTCGIVNWKKDEQHIIKTVNFKTASTEFKQRMTSEERGDGQGYGKFLFHSSLHDDDTKNTQYLHQDCLCLQVVKSEMPK